MLNIVRYSQVIGLITLDSPTTSHLGEVEEVWLNQDGRIAYLSSSVGYLPLEQVSGIGANAVSTYGQLLLSEPHPLHRLSRMTVQSLENQPMGWIEDFLFDWHSGEVVAYILGGAIAEPWGGRAVLFPEEVESIVTERVMLIREGAGGRLKSETEGLQGFMSEKSASVRHLIQVMGDRLHELLTPQDRPEVVRIKIKDVSQELATNDHKNHPALQEATEFLLDQWEHVKQSAGQASHRAQTALESAWKHLISSNKSGA
jgi:uncharacterized protein YrrD